MANDLGELKAALVSLAALTKPFAALGNLAKIVEPLLAVVNHEAELRASVAELQDQKAKLLAANAKTEKDAAAAKAERNRLDDAWEAEHLAKHKKIREDVAAAEADALDRVAKAAAKAKLAETQSATRVAAVESEVQRARDEAQRKHEAALKEMAKAQDDAAAKTAAIQAKLGDLRSTVSALA